LNRTLVDFPSEAGFSAELLSVAQEPGSTVLVSTEDLDSESTSPARLDVEYTSYEKLETDGCQLKYERLNPTSWKKPSHECRRVFQSYCSVIGDKNVKGSYGTYLDFDINIEEKGDRAEMTIPMNAWTKKDIGLLSQGMKFDKAMERMLFSLPQWMSHLQSIVLNLDFGRNFHVVFEDDTHLSFKFCRIWFRVDEPNLKSLNLRYYNSPAEASEEM
jgi:hypothetical protein